MVLCRGYFSWVRPMGILMTAMILLMARPSLVPAALTPSDGDIRDAVQDEISLDTAVPQSLIDVEVTLGVVTLTGTVDNLLAKERATRIAETVKGVRSVVNRIRVAPSELRTDSAVEDDVKHRLAKDAATDAYEIDVEASEGRVILTGTVDSWQESRLCARVAKGVRGVTAVKNDINVDYKLIRPDNEIQAEIVEAFHWNTLLDDALVRVRVRDGRVTLSGTVGSAAEKRRAHALAYVAGVSKVDIDELDVARWMRDEDLRKNKYIPRSDEQIEAALRDAFLYDPRVNTFNVEPDVKGGVVTLRGKVDNLKAKRAATRDARNTVGVAYVKNRLKVRPRMGISDAMIEENIRQSFRTDPVVERFDVTVMCINGLVDLYGTVDTYREKAKAEDVASRINGVIAVDNNIKVNRPFDLFPYEPYADNWRSSDYPWYHPPTNFSYTPQSDSRIKAEINNQLFWSPFVNTDQVDVAVDHGVATLTGEVNSWMEYRAASENAYEGGARMVINNISVN